MRLRNPFPATVVCLLAAALAAAAESRPAPDFAGGREVDPDFNLVVELPAPPDGRLVIAAGGAERFAFVRLGPDRSAAAGHAAAGADPAVTEFELPAPPWQPGLTCTVKLRSSSNRRYLAVTAGGRELCRAEIPALHAAPRLAFAGGGGGLKVLGYQKIDRSDPVLFTDDFTRRGEGLGAWTPDRPGVWGIAADPNPETSASPFAMECAPAVRPSEVLAGEEFWDDYRVSAAVSVLGSPGAGGLVFNAGEGGSWLLRLAVDGPGSGGAGRAELVHRPAGGPERVAASRALRGAPGSWYALELASCGGELRAWVDGAELAALSGQPGLVGGRFGLWSSGAGPVRVDDVAVRALELSPAEFRAGGGELAAELRHWFLQPPFLPQYFQNDHTMSAWSRLENEFRRDGTALWHRAHLAGDQEVAWRRPGSPLKQGQLVLALCADGADFASGYRAVADLGAGGAAVVAVFERDRRVGGTLLRLGGAGLESLSLSREAGRLLLHCGPRLALSVPDTLGLAAGRAGVLGLGGWQPEAREVRAAGAGLLDEVFARAPVEWHSATGGWEVSSRWVCDPEYTWLLGRQRRGVARLDLKRPVRGDFQLDIHFAVAMAERCAPFYDFPTNLTLALSPDPLRPTAGYVLAFGGIDQPGRILRAGREVASGGALVRPGARDDGGGGGIHSHWFHMRAVRRGAKLELWGDGQKLCEFADPEPLAGADHLALWTRGDNGVSLARFRLEAAGPLGERRSPFLAAGETIEVRPLPPPFGAFRNRDGAGGALLVPAADGKSLRLVNVHAGGSFAAAWAPPGGIDLARDGWLEFDWRTSPGARVNLYLLRGGVHYRARLTGPALPPGGRWNLRQLGEVPGAAAGTPGFQRFAFDLGAALAAAEPKLPDLKVDEIRLGNYEYEEGALLEGFAGNAAGDWVELAGWTLGPRPADAGFPPDAFVVDAPGASVPAGGRSGVPAFCDPRTFVVVSSGRSTIYDGAELRYDAFRRRLTYSPAEAGVPLADGASTLTLSARRFGGGEARTVKIPVEFDIRLDKRPPAPPRLVAPAPLDADDFERDLGGWESFAGADGAQLVRDDSTAAPGGGRWCLLGQNQRCGGTMAAMARSAPLDVRRYPTLVFDCRIEPRTCVNLLLFSGGQRYDLYMTDAQGGARSLGPVAGAAADGRWRRVEVDLEQALARHRRTIVARLGLADLGPGSSTTADAWRVDNWMLLPAVNGARPVEFRWAASDESGISGHSAVLDRAAGTVPREEVSSADPVMKLPGGLAAGVWYLHVRARDGAGNWGEPAHWRFKVTASDDREAPAVTSVSPAAGDTACPAFVEAVIAETGSGLSGHDVELAVGDRVFRPGDEGVTFVPSQGRLRVELTGFDGKLLVPAGELRCALRATDLAGNAMPEHRWTWRLDPAADRSEPPAPRVVYLPSDRLVFQDFESGQGTFANWRRGTSWRERARSRGEAGGGRWYLSTGGRRLHDNNNETQFWPESFDPGRYSHLAFDCRMAQGTSFDFMLQVGNRHHTVGLGPRSAGWTRRLDRFAEGRADGTWHRVELDLRGLPKGFPREADGRLAVIQKFLTTSGSQSGADIDNFVIGSPYGRDPEFVWEPPAAPSGIAGYAWCLDGKPDTEPPERVSGTEPRAAFQGVAPGAHWFHVRALSGAGRWGRSAHLRIVIEAQP